MFYFAPKLQYTMKELLLRYAQYNAWANKRIIDAISKEDESLADKEVPGSFPTLRATIIHTWAAEYVWLQRLQLAEYPQWMSGFEGTLSEACNNWQQTSADVIQFIEKQYDDRAFQHVVQYYDRSKVSHKTPVFQVLLHMFNHATYHRGQLVTMLRQLGVQDIPGTDLIGFAKGK